MIIVSNLCNSVEVICPRRLRNNCCWKRCFFDIDYLNKVLDQVVDLLTRHHTCLRLTQSSRKEIRKTFKTN